MAPGKSLQHRSDQTQQAGSVGDSQATIIYVSDNSGIVI